MSGTYRPGEQDALLASEAAKTLRDLNDPLFVRAWLNAGKGTGPLDSAGLAALQARLLVELFARTGVIGQDLLEETGVPGARAARSGTGSAFYRELFAPHQETVRELTQACRDAWTRLLVPGGGTESAGDSGCDLDLLAGVRALFAKLPVTSGADIAEDYRRFLRGSQDEVARVVTLATSGSTGTPKRQAFSPVDLERTRLFFAAGMAQILKKGDLLLVCLPGAEHPDGVADLLARGLVPLGMRVKALSSTASDEALFEGMERLRPQSLVLSPRQLAALFKKYGERRPEGLTSFLVSSDWCDPKLLRAVIDTWQVVGVDHYGITETGFGCALECPRRMGFHIRHLDVFCEVVDPLTLEPVGEGVPGELVLTTLRQDVMPLIRYRTGDAVTWRTDVCACGSPHSRLGAVLGRFAGGTRDIVHPRKAEREHLA